MWSIYTYRRIEGTLWINTGLFEVQQRTWCHVLSPSGCAVWRGGNPGRTSPDGSSWDCGAPCSQAQAHTARLPHCQLLPAGVVCHCTLCLCSLCPHSHCLEVEALCFHFRILVHMEPLLHTWTGLLPVYILNILNIVFEYCQATFYGSLSNCISIFTITAVSVGFFFYIVILFDIYNFNNMWYLTFCNVSSFLVPFYQMCWFFCTMILL